MMNCYKITQRESKIYKHSVKEKLAKSNKERNSFPSKEKKSKNVNCNSKISFNLT